MTLPERDLVLLRRAVELAREALEVGDEPFGALLADADGVVLAERRSAVRGGDHTRHPEFELARWAAAELDARRRAAATVYTSAEHCPMCAAAHAWNGLGTIVYASSSAQLSGWLAELGRPQPPVAVLPVGRVAPGVAVRGPDAGLAARVRELQVRFHSPG